MTSTLSIVATNVINLLLGQTAASDVGDRQSAVDIVTQFAESESRTGVWTGLDKGAFCARLAELVREPHKLDQGHTSWCAAAAALHLFALHYPRRFAQFGIRLYETGTTSVGTRSISMTTGIRATNITDWIVQKNLAINAADLVLMLAMLEDMTFLDIDEPTSYALSPPFSATAYGNDVKTTLGGSGLYATQEVSATAAGLAGATLGERSVIVVVGHMKVFSHKTGMLDGRHAAVLMPPVSLSGTTVDYTFWSWGVRPSSQTFPLVGGRHRRNSMSVSSFDAELDMAIVFTPNGQDI